MHGQPRRLQAPQGGLSLQAAASTFLLHRRVVMLGHRVASNMQTPHTPTFPLQLKEMTLNVRLPVLQHAGRPPCHTGVSTQASSPASCTHLALAVKARPHPTLKLPSPNSVILLFADSMTLFRMSLYVAGCRHLRLAGSRSLMTRDTRRSPSAIHGRSGIFSRLKSQESIQLLCRLFVPWQAG